MTFHDANRAFTSADLAWAKQLVVDFGRDAGTARYQQRGKGEAGSTLRRIWSEREEARRNFVNIRGTLFPQFKESA